MMRSLILFVSVAMGAASVAAQNADLTFTGTALTYGTGFNTRTTSRTFTLRLTGVTSNAEADRYLSVLRDQGQDGLLSAIDDNDLGSLTIGGRIGPRINAVRIDDVEGGKRVRVIFARWLSFSEIRGGYRSIDYPFGYMEIFYDPRTRKGDGTFIAAARIRFRESRNEVEVEDFGTFPGRLMGVKLARGRLP